ncbi:hypothetical protein GCM10010260_64990 [Streptomyces filipinensis]|uniref:Uncharacterized protein n=1 Tax=Streptomyces filipinensis TaxID=66887 RepID=A0A918IGS2_9ACTN|nr:hypothetical protein GCM10010260_64990 [Streptomyces filipinensis]
MFAGQYNHTPGGRGAGDDRYTITATAAGPRHGTVLPVTGAEYERLPAACPEGLS